jgi:hypothetical protein
MKLPIRSAAAISTTTNTKTSPLPQQNQPIFLLYLTVSTKVVASPGGQGTPRISFKELLIIHHFDYWWRLM